MNTHTTSRPSFLSRHGWRVALVASGALSAIGGPMHPSSDSEEPIREELATMTADPSWVPGHSLIAVGTLLMALGLWGAWRTRAWPRAGRVVLVAAAAVSVYVLETIAHLAAVVDSDELASGEAAPVAFTHLAMAAVLYPVTGIAVVALAITLARRQWTGASRALAVPGVIGGVAHASAVPLTLLLPDAEITPVFAVAGMMLALWSIAAGLVGIRSVATPEVRRRDAVTAGR
jgi:hypothetical protein